MVIRTNQTKVFGTRFEIRQRNSITKEKILKAREFIQALLLEHPDRVEVKTARARLALMLAELPEADLSDLGEAERICREILKKDARQASARLMLVNVLIYDTPHGKHEMQYEGTSGSREGGRGK